MILEWIVIWSDSSKNLAYFLVFVLCFACDLCAFFTRKRDETTHSTNSYHLQKQDETTHSTSSYHIYIYIYIYRRVWELEQCNCLMLFALTMHRTSLSKCAFSARHSNCWLQCRGRCFEPLVVLWIIFAGACWGISHSHISNGSCVHSEVGEILRSQQFPGWVAHICH